ncbi:hypothetical protein CRYUN_Cryun23aG0009300 [Craigia yunnanensis]
MEIITTLETPGSGRYKLNFDGAVNKATKMGGIGVITKNGEGAVMGAYAGSLPGILCPFIVEANAAICSLKLAQQIGFYSIEIKGDALGIMRKLPREGE